MIDEIQILGVKYRGPFPPLASGGKWKIAALLPSTKIFASGRRVEWSWQTWGLFDTAAIARAALADLQAKSIPPSDTPVSPCVAAPAKHGPAKHGRRATTPLLPGFGFTRKAPGGAR